VKTSGEDVTVKENGEFLDLLFSHSALDANKDYFQVIYYLLKNIETPSRNTEAALLIYIIKSLQKHIEILRWTQYGSQTAQIIPQKLLKLIYKQLQKIDLKANPLLKKNLSTYDRLMTELLFSFKTLIPKHKEVQP
jgi:hypothetical protein